jgi:hypothetical protein
MSVVGGVWYVGALGTGSVGFFSLCCFLPLPGILPGWRLGIARSAIPYGVFTDKSSSASNPFPRRTHVEADTV